MVLTKVTLVTLLILLTSCYSSRHEVSRLNFNNDNEVKTPDVPKAKEEIKFYIGIEFVLYQSQISEFPVTSAAFHKAVKEWDSNLPLITTLYYEDPTMTALLHGPMFANMPGIIEVLICDLQSPLIGLRPGIIGLWDANQNRLLLDGDSLESKPDIAFSASLHELGHLFGLPHIVSIGDRVLTGWIGLNTDASDYVMYPNNIKDKGQNILSDIEINLAIDHVLHNLTSPRRYKKDDCFLTND